jgi:hypothetical protein
MKALNLQFSGRLFLDDGRRMANAAAVLTQIRVVLIERATCRFRRIAARW